jgi:hypothetical protein
MYKYRVETCKKDCTSQHTNKPTEIGRRQYDYDEPGYKRCIHECNTTIIPLNHYDVKTATKNGWYIFSKLNLYQSVEYYLAHTIMTYHNPYALHDQVPTSYVITTEMDKKLDELPDLQKTYKTGPWYKKKLWKLMYNEGTRIFEWTNQKDKEIPQPFLIASPLKIGDNIATEVK